MIPLFIVWAYNLISVMILGMGGSWFNSMTGAAPLTRL
jgi:hypothetical protein